MADESHPKPPPEEGPTRTFKLKLDGWMSEMLSDELDPNAPAKPAEPASPAPSAAPPTPPAAPPTPPAATP